MSTIVPTVGRVVLCFNPKMWEGARPGLIARCWGHDPSSAVNVSVLLDGGNDGKGLVASTFWMTSVQVHDPRGPDDEAPGSQWCEWMPYQKGQAAKAEAAEGPLNKAVCDCMARLKVVEAALHTCNPPILTA